MNDHEATREREPATTGTTFDSEIGYGTLLKLGFGLLALVVVAAVLMYFLFARFLEWERNQEPEPPVMNEARAPVLVPGPKLLSFPEGNLATYEAQVDERLHGYGYVDRGQGTVHIPIDRAIEIVAERGLPSLPGPETDAPEAEPADSPETPEAPQIVPIPEPGTADGTSSDESDDGGLR